MGLAYLLLVALKAQKSSALCLGSGLVITVLPCRIPKALCIDVWFPQPLQPRITPIS